MFKSFGTSLINHTKTNMMPKSKIPRMANAFRKPNRSLKAVAAGEPVYITEGEKDALALVRLGLCATCNAGGAGKWQDGYSTTLKGAGVVILESLEHAQARGANILCEVLG